MGLFGHLSTRLQPNHPTDDPRGVIASILDGLLLGSGDAMIGINPAQDSPARVLSLLELIDRIRNQWEIPTQSCVLTHITTQIALMEKLAPLDLVFQSIGGTERLNEKLWCESSILKEALDAARSLQRGTVGNQVMYFETGQGSALSAGAHHGIDSQTCEVRAYAVARAFDPFLVNSVVGFIRPVSV